MRRVPDVQVAEFGWLTADQQWAMRLAMEAGLELHPVGPIALRGFDRSPAPYVPTGAFG
jgi:hypothetical protein